MGDCTSTKKFIDLHVHVGPEIIPRRFTAAELAKAEEGKMRGFALKNHFYPTTPFIKELGNRTSLKLMGSIVLNNYVGGLNPDAVYSAAKLSDLPIIVWFPTINAENFLARSKYEIPKEWFGKGFRPRPSSAIKGIRVAYKSKLVVEAKEVLKAVKDNGCVIATGHISWQDARLLVEEALSIGIDKIILTHPIYQRIAMPISVQRELCSGRGVYAEQAYSMYSIDKISIGRISAQIKSLGAQKCIISSDMGQIGSPSPSDALLSFSNLLLKNGITMTQIRTMAEANPYSLMK
jgi:hypothetical protein